MDNKKRLKKNLLMFPLGTVGRDMIYQLFTNFILLYVLFTHNLTAAQLMAITVIMIAARVFDAFNDPVMGNIIERTRTRWGKYKPWLVIGIITTSIVVWMAFNVQLEGWAFIAFFAVIYIGYSITYTMHDISYWGMVPSLGSDGNIRDQFTARATLFAGIGGTLASVLIPLFTTGAFTIGGNAQKAYGIVATVICILAPLFLCFTIIGVQENRDYMQEAAPPVSFKKILSTIGGNDQLVWVSIIFLIQQVGNGIAIGGIGSTYIYFSFGYEGGLYSLFTTIGMMATAFLMIFYPMISKKVNRKPLLGFMALIATIGYVIMFAVGIVMPDSMTKFWVITMTYMLTNFGQYCYYLVLMISIINTVEYNEYKHGVRDEAIIASLRPFLTKLASALIVLITTVSYLIFGVTGFTNQISALEQQTNMGVITEAEKLTGINAIITQAAGGQRIGLLTVMSVLPCVLLLISYFMYKKHYKLDEDEYARIVKELESRKAK